ncbi:MAG: FeoB-associated Cys-rich membrane protein [Muribaculaceae bacterium]|nr:FeoB-associated Cys-rich membrane protein [Muribaculaceae bacterium]
MSDSWQYIIVGIVVAVAFTLAIRSIYRAITHKKSALNPCGNCSLKDVCNKKSSECDKK